MNTTYPERARRYLGGMLSWECMTGSDGTLTYAAVSWLVGLHSHYDAIVVCPTGEVEAAVAVIDYRRRCRLTVHNESEMAAAAHRLAEVLRLGNEAANS